MGTMVSQITSLIFVYSTVYLGADQRKHQSSASLAFVRGIHRWPVNSAHKWPVTRKMFPIVVEHRYSHLYDILYIRYGGLKSSVGLKDIYIYIYINRPLLTVPQVHNTFQRCVWTELPWKNVVYKFSQFSLKSNHSYCLKISTVWLNVCMISKKSWRNDPVWQDGCHLCIR